MGSLLELNDTLQITSEQGFPFEVLDLEKHQTKSVRLEDVKDRIFSFANKPGARIFQLAPTRCFLVHNIAGKWVYWGKIHMIEQTITRAGDGHVTSGKYQIVDLYDPEYQKGITKHETNQGESYFV